MVHGKCCPAIRLDIGPDIGTEGAPAAGLAQVREIDSRALFGEARTVAIRHGSETYTLRITRADKLILTK